MNRARLSVAINSDIPSGGNGREHQQDLIGTQHRMRLCDE